jgi:hypothetical protein
LLCFALPCPALLCRDGAHIELVLDGVIGQVRDDQLRLMGVDQPNAFRNEGLGIETELRNTVLLSPLRIAAVVRRVSYVAGYGVSDFLGLLWK